MSVEQVNSLEAQLVACGWPVHGTRIEDQHLEPLVPAALVKRLAPDEDQMVLLPPPFVTVAEDAQRNPDFWRDFGAMDQLHPEDAVLVADFGLGSDTAIIVDLHSEPARVMRLVWADDGNRWVEVAPSVDTFLPLLGFA